MARRGSSGDESVDGPESGVEVGVSYSLVQTWQLTMGLVPIPEYNMNPVVRDSMRFDGKMSPPEV